MEGTQVQKTARLLKCVVKGALVCNVLGMLIAPSVLCLGKEDLLFYIGTRIQELLGHPGWDSEPVLVLLFGGLGLMWEDTVVLAYTGFLWFCGGCAAVILWQALTILDTILQQQPFQAANARAMKYAAAACWGISAAALIRLIAELAVLKNTAPLFTYNALFIPVFFAGGLLFLVMSALFGQAAAMKEEQDLTI